jgi:two-component sensor histidine kinase
MIYEQSFPNSLNAATQARKFVVDHLGDLSPEVRQDAAVMVSELATNSIRHAASKFTVSVERVDHHVRVAVDDTGPGAPILLSPLAADPTGRGLRIVEALAATWGVIPHNGGRGKCVWFTLPEPHR